MSLYEKSAQILEKVSKQEGTIKSLILSNPKVHEKKATYALVCQSLKYKQAIDSILQSSKLLELEKKLSPFLAQILIYEFLFGKKQLKRAGKHGQLILKHKTRLQAELVRLKLKLKCKTDQDLIPLKFKNSLILPKYIRVNTLKTSVEKVMRHFVGLGFECVEYSIENIRALNKKQIIQDIHIPELFLLHGSIDLHLNENLLNGHVIIQDKASCFPAFLLNPPLNAHVIDACAAPGNKTSHCSAIMKNTGKIFAFDMDQKRLKTLKKLSGLAGCTNIVPECANFLSIDPMNSLYKDVEFIILDPSCSGSGMVSRMDHLLVDNEQSLDAERLDALQAFQKQAILHAFKFPRVQKVVYSTCSIHQQENEDVVDFILQEQEKFVLEKNLFPQWTRRGLPHSLNAHEMIRTESSQDYTIGFFVAVFIRQE